MSQSIYIRSMGHYVPDTILDNEFFSKLNIGSEGQWIEDRIGIRERRSILTQQELMDVKDGRISIEDLKKQNRIMSLGDFGVRIWDLLKSRTSLDTMTPDTVINGTSIPDDDIPANACSIATKIGFGSCVAYDVNSACSTFILELQTLSALMQSGISKKFAAFCIDRYTTRTNYNDKKTCILFGDSGAGFFAEYSDKKGGLKLIDTFLESNPASFHLIRMPYNEFFDQNGQAVQKFAIQKTISAAQHMMEKHNLKTTDVKYFVSHQANFRMLEYCVDKMGFSKEQHLYNVDLFGNQGAAGAPCVLSMNWEKYKPGDYIVVAAVGAGLTWGSALLQMT